MQDGRRLGVGLQDNNLEWIKALACQFCDIVIRPGSRDSTEAG